MTANLNLMTDQLSPIFTLTRTASWVSAVWFEPLLKAGEKNLSQQRYLLDTLPERRTMTMHHEISARRSLMPAGDDFRYLVPDQAVREGNVGS